MNEGQPVSHRYKPKRREWRARPIWRTYAFELIGLIAAGLGIFLVFGRMSLEDSLASWFRETARRLLGHFQRFDSSLDAFLAEISISDVVGSALVIGAAAVILLRIRWRLLTNQKLVALVCPKCGGPIRRIHRTRADRLISAYVPVQRYRCGGAVCRWHGLRVGKHHESQHRRAASSS